MTATDFPITSIGDDQPRQRLETLLPTRPY